MSTDLVQLQARRAQILQEMAAIDRLCRGHLSEQFFQGQQGGKAVRRGPYYVLQRWFRGKNLCERVPAAQVEPIRQGVAGYQRFRQLADEFVDVCEELTRQTGGLSALKKKTGLAVVEEQFRETTRFLSWAKEQLVITGTAVMGCLEEKLRDALRADACRCLEDLLNDPAVQVPDDHTRPGESCHAGRPNTVASLFGP